MGQQGMLDTEKAPRQARAIIHVENNCHGGIKYRALSANYNPAAGGTAGLELVRNRDFEIALWIGSHA